MATTSDANVGASGSPDNGLWDDEPVPTGIVPDAPKETLQVDKETDLEAAEGIPLNPDEDDSEDSDPLEKPIDKKDDISIDLEKFPMRETRVQVPFNGGELRFNHVTSAIGILLLWGLATWCMVDPEGSREELIRWRQQSAQYFTWFYIGTRPVFMFFILFVGIRFRNVRLGPPDSQPEFSNGTYFAMLFAAGVAVGLFFYGVSEPLWHQSSHWYANAGYRAQDEIDQFAMNQTLFHWGLAAWAGYVVVGIACGLAAYRFGLPLTFRSGMYCIFGDYTWGWIGDVVDGLTIVVTVAGVCTSLGLGAMQITAGLQRIGWVESDLSDSRATDIQVIIIWCITAIATASVISGLSIGIKYLSDIAFCFGMFLLFTVFVLDSTSYQLNLLVQSVGYYLQNSIYLVSFWTDAFGQLRPGEGRAIDDAAAASWWMDAWTVFYMAWWTSWSGFVGLFIARISKGRTLSNVVFFSLLCPLAYSFIWFGIFGGVGLRQARQALEIEKFGNETFGDAAYFQTEQYPNCYNVPQDDIVINGTTVFTNHLPGVTPVCYFDPSNADNSWFNVMYSFSYPKDFENGLGGFLSVVSIIAVALYFVTSSDSGSLIVDHLASNGHEEHHWLQRLFWALTEGAVASALLVSGGAQSLQALQAASIVAGLPFTVIMCYMLQSIYEMCVLAEKDEELPEPGENDFATPVYGGIFNCLEWLFSWGNVNSSRVEKGMDKPKKYHVTGFFIDMLVPFITLRMVLFDMNPKPSQKFGNNLTLGVYTVMHFAWIALFISVAASSALRVFGWTAFFSNGIILMSIKGTFRKRYNIRGDLIGDFLSSLFAYPQVLVQLREECKILGLPQETEE